MAQRRKCSKKWIPRLIFFALLTVVGVVCYLVWDNYFNDKKTEEEYSKSEAPQQIIEEETEDVVDNDADATVLEQDEKKVVQYEGKDPNKREELSGSITYAGVLNNNITVRVNIDQYINEGTCEIKLMKGEQDLHSESARIIGSVSTATCEGFDIPVSAVGSGRYNIVINLKSGDKIGTITGEVNI